MRAPVFIAEKCRVCGCTKLNPCIAELNGQKVACTWYDLDHTLCTRSTCIGSIPLSVLEEMPLFRLKQ
jgi:hypothetical protein